MQDPKDPTQKPAATDAGESKAGEPAAPAARRPYDPPRIVAKDKLEGRANVCDPFTGKTAPPSCGVNRS